MLSRIAESLFWIGRYVERADDTARILDVQMQVLVDNGLPAQPHRYVKCGKRGCHEQKPMLFDPAKAEPTAESLHRGW